MCYRRFLLLEAEKRNSHLIPKWMISLQSQAQTIQTFSFLLKHHVWNNGKKMDVWKIKKSFFWCYQGISALHKLIVSVFCADTFVHYKNCLVKEENYSDFMWSLLFYRLVYIFLVKKGVKKEKKQNTGLLPVRNFSFGYGSTLQENSSLVWARIGD